MNIKSRIRKLERTTNSGGYCLCFGALKYDAVLRHDNPEEIEKAPDICPDCGKPVDKRSVEISFEQYQKEIEERVRQAARTLELFTD